MNPQTPTRWQISPAPGTGNRPPQATSLHSRIVSCDFVWPMRSSFPPNPPLHASRPLLHGVDFYEGSGTPEVQRSKKVDCHECVAVRGELDRLKHGSLACERGDLLARGYIP